MSDPDPQSRDSGIRFCVKGTVSRDFFLLVSPQPQSIPLGPFYFEFVRKFAEVFAIKGAPPVSTTQAAN